MIIFKRVTVKNFMSIGNSPVTIDLTKSSTTIVSGTNGSCKTAIFIESLTMGLFNKTIRDLNKGNVVNSINNKDCKIEIEFYTNNTDYKVVRGIKPNIFEIYEDDILMNQHADARDQQEYLEQKILKCNFNTFIQIVAISSMKYTPFMHLQLSQRREIVDQLIGNSIYTDMRLLAKTNCDTISKEIEIKKVYLSSLKDKIAVLNNNIAIVNKNTESLLDDLKQMIHEKEQLLNSYLHELSLINISEVSNDINDIMQSIQSQENSLNIIKKKRYNADNASTIASKYIKFYSSNDSCPECKQQISTEFKTTAINEHNETLNKVYNAKIMISERESVILERIASMQSKLNVLRDMTNKANSINAQISQTRNDISTLISKYNSANNRTGEDKNDLIKQLDEYKTLYETEYSVYETLVENSRYYKELFDMFKDDGIKAILVKQYIPIINEVVNSYLEEFELPVKFELDEKFNETILSRYKDKFCYENFSTGERQKIDLSLMFAWREIAKRRNSVDCNLLILDEMDAALYKDQLEIFCDCIEKMANKNNLNIFLISHRLSDIAVDKFKSSIHLSKINNFVVVS